MRLTISIMILTLIIISCNTENEIDETEIMNTVCINGIKYLSVMNGLDCYYHPLEVDGKYIKCGE